MEDNNEIKQKLPAASQALHETLYLFQIEATSGDNIGSKVNDLMEIEIKEEILSFYTKPIFKPRKYEVF